ncbi:uncharacterized protein LOC131297915 isoform X1 [Rhododendron vialii]|uniref:uncharacterized protein LOC131297915 isoform X1 n=2 Tax=Rhododendron vialii TaxID=182163 RepID=UPI00265E7BEE|nr:uncharacterized protein LOC131297915 isoform X1 [Rhododendron vialii]
MPTFTAIALDRLIEPGAAKSMTTVTNVSDSKLDRRNNTINSKLERRNSTSTRTTLDKKHHWARIKPALYATPKSTPLPDSPSSFAPSPYIVDHKRRGPRLLKSYSDDDVAGRKRAPEEEKVGDNTKVAGKETTDLTEDVACSVTCPVEQEHVNGISSEEPVISELSSSSAAQNGSAVQNGSAKSVEEGGELEDFLDPQDSMSAKSNTEGDSNSGVERSLYQTTPVAEFYDAWEELSSDNGRQPPPLDIECELREIRLSLLMEIENRKQAEEALDNMRSQWLRIRQQLSFVGLTIPAEPISLAEDERLGVDPVEELCRQVYLARFVSHSIGRGTAKAEVEMEMETHIESKNFEIARLWDKLHYYEAVNREMSQRNQEAVEVSRRLRQIRKRRQSWVWGSIAAAITLGTGALAWTYLSTGGQSSSTSKSVAPQQDFAAE